MKTNRTTKEREIELLASEYNIPILFRNDIEKSENELIENWSDGYKFIYTIKVTPIIIKDNDMVQLNGKLNFSMQKANEKTLNESNGF